MEILLPYPCPCPISFAQTQLSTPISLLVNRFRWSILVLHPSTIIVVLLLFRHLQIWKLDERKMEMDFYALLEEIKRKELTEQQKKNKRKRSDEDGTDSVFSGVRLVLPSDIRASGKCLMTWNEFDPGKRPCYHLYKIEDIDKIDELGRDVFNQLRSDITWRCVCQLMLLAYNLKDAQGNHVFGDIPNQLVDTKDMEEFSEIEREMLFEKEVLAIVT